MSRLAHADVQSNGWVGKLLCDRLPNNANGLNTKMTEVDPVIFVEGVENAEPGDRLTVLITDSSGYDCAAEAAEM